MTEYAFGWISQAINVEYNDIIVRPMNGFDQINREIIEYIGNSNWIHTPRIEKEGAFSVLFHLPANHQMVVDGTKIDVAMADRLIMALGFLVGVPLRPTGLGHLHKVPYKPQSLVNFFATETEIGKCLYIVQDFYKKAILQDQRAGTNCALLMDAAIHWYLSSQCYESTFEIFAWQYSVLDNIHALQKKMDPNYETLAKIKNSHDVRAINLSNHLGIAFPPEFVNSSISSVNAKALSDVRNELIHEARWLGKPLGYAVDEDTFKLTNALKNFNSQLILSCFGINCEFKSHAYSAQMHALGLK